MSEKLNRMIFKAAGGGWLVAPVSFRVSTRLLLSVEVDLAVSFTLYKTTSHYP
jgi:hypothetical protein